VPRFDYGPQSYVWPVRLAETKSVAVELIPAKFLEVSVSLFRGWLVSKNPRNTPLEYSRTHLGWPNTPRGKLGFVLSYIRRGFRPVRQSSLPRVDESSHRESTTSSNVRALWATLQFYREPDLAVKSGSFFRREFLEPSSTGNSRTTKFDRKQFGVL